VVALPNTLSDKKSSIKILRISCALLIVLFGLLDLLFSEATGRIFWLYSCTMVSLVAISCLIIAGWGHQFSSKQRWARVGRQFFHWLGFVGVVYLLNSLVDMGTFLPKNAGLILLGLLGFCVYLAGLTIDLWLVLVGVVLVFLAMSVVWVHQHLWLMIIPVGATVIFVLTLIVILHKKRPRVLNE